MFETTNQDIMSFEFIAIVLSTFRLRSSILGGEKMLQQLRETFHDTW